MGREVISQVLSPTNATYINGVSARRLISSAVLANVYQGLVETDNRGVNSKWLTEKEVDEATQVFVNRVLPIKMKPREHGSSKNGGSYNVNSNYPQTITVGIDILTILDETIKISRASKNLIAVDLLAEQIEIYSKRKRVIINGMTFASKYLGSFLAETDGKEINKVEISATDIANKLLPEKLITANSLLDEGDIENGIDIFPQETRIAVFKVGYRPTLKASGVLLIGGANYAYDILKSAGISTEAKATKLENGYWGDIDGVPCHGISNESLRQAADFLGFSETEIIKGDFIGYVSSSYANARGVSTIEEVKIVDDPAGQGIILQPFSKMGAVSWYPKGNVMLVKDTFTNLYTFLKGLFTGNAITFKLKGAASRLYPVGKVSTLTATAFTITAASEDDFGTDHIVSKGYYVVSDKEVKTVGEFAKAYNAAGATKGDFTVGTSKTQTVASGKVLTALCIADDGSVSLFNKAQA